MTAIEILDRDISSLKELLRVAWVELGSPSLTPHARREARNRVTRCSADLRRNLKMLEAARRKLREQELEQQGGPGPAKPVLRILQGGL
jgi:hypothetical protein